MTPTNEGKYNIFDILTDTVRTMLLSPNRPISDDDTDVWIDDTASMLMSIVDPISQQRDLDPDYREELEDLLHHTLLSEFGTLWPHLITGWCENIIIDYDRVSRYGPKALLISKLPRESNDECREYVKRMNIQDQNRGYVHPDPEATTTENYWYPPPHPYCPGSVYRHTVCTWEIAAPA